MTTQPRQFDLIAFDWDGTLADSTAIITRCIQAAALDVCGVQPSDEDASYVIGMGLVQALRHAVPQLSPDDYPRMAERYKFHYSKHSNDIFLFKGVEAMLNALKAKQHILTVATGKGRKGLDDVLSSVALHGFFDGSRTADQTAGKPNPLMLHELMEEFNVPPERTLMIGDTTHDLGMAQNADCACVGVSYGAHDHEAFEEFKPLYVAHSVADLHQWLELYA